MGTRDSSFKQERKAEELELADVVICPSQFVCRSLPAAVKNHKPCVIAEFGSPEVLPATRWRTEPDLQRPLRLLFAGSMSQRKGLADLFAALRSLRRPDVELVVLGTPLMPMRFYRRQFPSFIYERSRSHEEVLGLMQRCDVLVLPSIVEGRALVQQEALSCGLPLIVTAHAGGEDLIEEGRTGFLVPIRDPETLAARIAWCADHRLELEAMRGCARRKAADYTWRGYAEKILSALPVGRAETAAAA
jgi:glycosyltransferase involved in cell wall biosynthesis